MSDINEIGNKPENFDNHENIRKGIKLFFGEAESNFFGNAGREVTEGIVQESLLLYRIDLQKTKTHALYGEAKSFEKRYKPEVEIFGRINVEVLDPTYQAGNNLLKKGFGKLTAHIYLEHLKELGLVELNDNQIIVLELKIGDFIGFKGQFYEIKNDGYSQISNEHSWAGDRRFYITVEAIEVDEDVFKGR